MMNTTKKTWSLLAATLLAFAAFGGAGTASTMPAEANPDNARQDEAASAASEAADQMFVLCGLRTDVPPVPCYYLGGNETEMVFWTMPDPQSVGDEDDEVFGDPSSFATWRVQDLARTGAASYTRMGDPLTGRFFPVRFRGQVPGPAGDEDFTGVLRPAGSAMEGLAYGLAEPDEVCRAMRADRPPRAVCWLFADGYLNNRRQLASRRPAAGEIPSMPAWVVAQLERRHGMTCERSGLLATFGDKPVCVGYVQFAEAGGKKLALDVVTVGDEMWTAEQWAYEIDRRLDWAIEGDGNYHGLDPQYAFDGPDGPEILFRVADRQTVRWGYITLGDGQRTDENLIAIAPGQLRITAYYYSWQNEWDD